MEPRIVYKVEDLAVGVPTKWPIRDRNGKLMLRSGYVIKDENELNLVRGLMGNVTDEDADDSFNRFKPVKIPPRDNPFDLFKLIQRRVEGLLLSDLDRATDFPQKAFTVCSMIQELCYEDEDLALGAAFLDKYMQYTIKHPIHVAIVCEVIAKALNYSKEDRKSVMAAALTMNISVLELQESLQTQSTPLSKNQRVALAAHPVTDFRALQRLGVTDEVWLAAVLQHHESIDGSGYPQGIRGQNVTVAAQLVSLADIYAAMVSSRSYRLPMPANEAMKKVFLTSSQKVNELLAVLFIKNLGIYPPGAIVRLQNGEIGIVTYRGSAANLPAVQAIIRSNSMPHSCAQPRDASAAEYKIVETLPQTQINFAINNEQLWGHGDFAKKGIAKRRHERAAATCPAMLAVEGLPPIHAEILNISASGCLLQIPFKSLHQELKEDRPYKLSFTILNKTLTDIRFIMRNASISGKKHLLGIKFIDMPDDHKTTIALYLDSIKK